MRRREGGKEGRRERERECGGKAREKEGGGGGGGGRYSRCIPLHIFVITIPNNML